MPTSSGHTTAILASKVKGTSVYNTGGDKIGHVEDVVLDKKSDQIMFAALGFGGILGMAHVAVPFVEPGILASVVALGLLVAAAADLPVGVGAAIIGTFALLHGHAHGSEIPETAGGVEYVAGFVLATASLHILGIGAGLAFGTRFRVLVRAAGAACALIGVGLAVGMV